MVYILVPCFVNEGMEIYDNINFFLSTKFLEFYVYMNLSKHAATEPHGIIPKSKLELLSGARHKKQLQRICI